MKHIVMRTWPVALTAVFAGVVYLVGYQAGSNEWSLFSDANAQEAKRVPAKPDLRDVYYPGTEEIGPNEMRIVACGTGMPSVRPKQAAACFLVELGNGDKFL